MSEDRTATAPGTPWHLWVLGVLALLWNGFGAYDYLMTQTQNASYMASFTPEQLEYFYGFPTWVVAFWAIAVWFGVLGAILLLARKRLAAPIFLISFVAMVLTSIHNFLLSDGLKVMGGMGAAFSLAIFIIALFLWLYARALVRQGVLT